jgi:hypothetical protein
LPASFPRRHSRATERQRLTVLSEATRAFACDGTRLEPALQAALKRTAELLGGTCRLTFLTDDGRSLTSSSTSSRDADGPLPLDGPEAEVARTGQPLLSLEPPVVMRSHASVV